MYAVTITILILITAGAGLFTVVTRKDYQKAWNNYWLASSTTSTQQLEEHRVAYGLCLGVLVFASILTTGMSLIWVCMEFILWPAEQRNLQRMWWLTLEDFRDRERPGERTFPSDIVPII